MSFDIEYRKIKNTIIKFRRQVHQNPELGFSETKTANAICQILDQYNIDYERNICHTGIVAQIGDKSEKVLLIRADMDALPIEENTNLEFKSVNKGVMHACGHDLHMSSVLATAIILKKHEKQLNGSVKIVFQPAEETTGGALPMINHGILRNPDVTCAISAHVTPELPVGEISIKSGPLMASPDDFKIEIIGKSAHGAQPQKGINPISTAVDIVKELELLSKELFSKDKSILTVCSLIADGGVNIIPDKALILGTYRSFDENARKQADKRIYETSEKLAKANGCQIQTSYNYLYPPLVNDKNTFDFFVECAKEILEEENIHILSQPLMTGEDFSYFCREIPSVFFWYGANNGSDAPLHSSELILNEDAIWVSSSLFWKFTMEYLR